MGENMNRFFLEDFCRKALSEDIGFQDHSTAYLFDGKSLNSHIVCKSASGILCGTEIIKILFELLDKKISIQFHKKDGELIKAGEIIMEFSGNASSILQGERTALNILAYLSGISTKANEFKKLLNSAIMKLDKKNLIDQANKIKISDTRKILPLYRQLVKYAVHIGGLTNHRYNLSDGIMLKENHIKAFGSISGAIKKLRENSPFMLKIECETENFGQFHEAYSAGADVIMLDEFTPEDYLKTEDFLKTHQKNFLLEISGNLSEEKLLPILKLGLPIDILSIGTNLTLSVNVIDFSMRYQ